MLNKIKVLGSNSSGCGYLLYFDNFLLAFDAGVEHSEMPDVYLISHEHSDHLPLKKVWTNKSKKLYKEVPLYINSNVYKNNEDSKWQYFKGSKKLEHITIMKVKHDSGCKMKESENETYYNNRSFHIVHEDTSILYLTDCGDIEKFMIDNKSDLKQIIPTLDVLFLEVNWDWQKLYSKKNKNFHDLRTMSELGHMSNYDSLKFIYQCHIRPHTKILFIHKSSANAVYDETYKMFDHLPNKWIIAKTNQIIYAKTWKELT